MNTLARLKITAGLLLVPVACKHPLIAFLLLLAFGSVFLDAKTILRECRLGTPTLIVDTLTGKIIAPLRTMVPELSYFSTDFGKQGSEYAQPAKWNQEVISHLLAAPAAERFTPGSGLGSNTQNPKDLLTDCKVRINLGAKVSIKLPVVDAVKYFLSDAFMQTQVEAVRSLGRFVLADAVAKFNQGCFSQEYVVTKAANEYSKINRVRGALNKLGTRTPRFILGETDWMANLAEDPTVISGDYYGQKTGDDPYLTLQNMAGFSQIREYPNMPTNTIAVGNATIANAGDVFTLAAHGLTNGMRIRLTNIVTSTGISVDTDYYVKGATTNTFQVAATPGGAAVVIGTGDGTADVSLFEGLNGLAFERRAVHIAFRQLLDNSELARALQIPETSRKVQARDEDTGLPVTWHFWEDTTGANPTGDVYATAVVAYGIVAGREITDPDTPMTQAAGSGMDYGAIRLVETAAALAA